MADPKFVDAVNRRGARQRIPAAWLAPGSPFADRFAVAESPAGCADCAEPEPDTTPDPLDLPDDESGL